MLFDPRARNLDDTPTIATFSVAGTLVTSNGTVPTMQGIFTFTNNSMASMYDPTAALRQGSVSCFRDPTWEWYRQSINPYWMILLVPAFSAVLSLWNLQPIRNRNFPVMVIISCVGYTANYFANLCACVTVAQLLIAQTSSTGPMSSRSSAPSRSACSAISTRASSAAPPSRVRSADLNGLTAQRWSRACSSWCRRVSRPPAVSR